MRYFSFAGSSRRARRRRSHPGGPAIACDSKRRQQFPRKAARPFRRPLGCPQWQRVGADAHHFRDIPLVTTHFAKKLPKAELRIVSPDYLESSDGLASGEIDAVLCPAQAVPAGQPFQELYAEGFAFVVRRDHPRVNCVKSCPYAGSDRRFHPFVFPCAWPGIPGRRSIRDLASSEAW